jgi:hypothetical protein
LNTPNGSFSIAEVAKEFETEGPTPETEGNLLRNIFGKRGYQHSFGGKGKAPETIYSNLFIVLMLVVFIKIVL